ncbi:MBL fold metallo-hydrolase [Sphingobacterium deserti]|uniref:Beta-lactamase domain protein n=1 Tax=Sphingobacterium deserti TaxID=1229276 RepID=A0A0B8T6T2_9SPHI|nr:MBL fold metallo-hydrolase [Sphingobacterium deserti]KGE13889.1 beta-lactamase domain protein [Sphingobacterium deserti]
MIKAYSLYEGSFSVDASKAFVPFDPEKDDPLTRKGSIFVHVHPFLVVSDDGLILCDTGLGFSDEGGLLLHQNIRKLGYDPDDVKYVLMSHLHKDHTGGMVDFKDGVARIAFPNAEYFVQRGEWEYAFSGENSSYRTEIFDVIQRSGNLVLLDGDGQINPQIRYEVNGAHTPHHQAFHIHVDDEHYFFGGDVLPDPVEIFKNFIAKYDYDGRKARDLRNEYWEKGRADNWTYLFYHSKSIAIGKGEQREDGSYHIVDVAKK